MIGIQVPGNRLRWLTHPRNHAFNSRQMSSTTSTMAIMCKRSARLGRARWKIENETFNTLKNQGYQFGHNFGHGKQNLSTIFVMLMMLAFLVDQTQELCCPLFQAVRKKRVTRRSLWDHQRSHFRHFEFTSMQQLHETMLYDLAKKLPVPAFASRGRARVP